MSDQLEDGWIKWDGGECPVDPETMVVVRLRNGVERVASWASAFQWGRFPETADLAGAGYDIIAYRLVEQSK